MTFVEPYFLGWHRVTNMEDCFSSTQILKAHTNIKKLLVQSSNQGHDS